MTALEGFTSLLAFCTYSSTFQDIEHLTRYHPTERQRSNIACEDVGCGRKSEAAYKRRPPASGWLDAESPPLHTPGKPPEARSRVQMPSPRGWICSWEVIKARHTPAPTNVTGPRPCLASEHLHPFVTRWALLRPNSEHFEPFYIWSSTLNVGLSQTFLSVYYLYMSVSLRYPSCCTTRPTELRLRSYIQ